MSLVKANTYQDASGGSNAVFSGVASPPNSMGFRNRIINGNMVIDQRNAGASITPANGQYLTDRWIYSAYQASKITAQQSTVAPAGFTNSLLITSTSAYTVGASEYFVCQQRIEGFNVADLGWGAAGAQTVTLSFWVRSSLTGTFGGSLNNSGLARSYPFSFTISAANTWEQKTVTVAGDTTGTWLTNNGVGLYVSFNLGSGSTFSTTAGAWTSGTYTASTGATSVVGTNGATFYITGVQLEAGTNASAFEQIDYGRQLIQCQRYCRAYSSYAMGRARDSDTVFGPGIIFGTTMRATPTLRSGASFIVGGGTAGTPVLSTGTGYASSPDIVLITGSGSSWGSGVMVAFTGIFEAEL